MKYAILEHQFRLFGLVKRYNFVGVCSTHEKADQLAQEICMGRYTIKAVNDRQVAAMTHSMLTDMLGG